MTRQSVPEAAALRWLASEESPFGVSVLDCRPVTQTLVSTTGSADVAARFVELRTSAPKDLDELRLIDCVDAPSGLRYPFGDGAQPTGAVFRAAQMEEKWDIYLREGRFVFLRSWTGEPIYAAQVSWSRGAWEIVQISRADRISEQPARSIQAVDYLVKSHLYNLAAPHPLQNELEGDDERLAVASFSEFGRRALYGTLDDLVSNVFVQEALWGR